MPVRGCMDEGDEVSHTHTHTHTHSGTLLSDDSEGKSALCNKVGEP